jgi:hypothetical protein
LFRFRFLELAILGVEERRFWMRRKENAPTRQQKLIVGDSRDSKEPLSGRVLYILHEYDYLSYKSNMK